MGMMRDLWTSRATVAAFVAVGLYWGAFAALVPVLKVQAGLSDGGFGLAMLVSTFGALLAMWSAPAADGRLGRLALPVLTLVMAAAFLTPGLATGGLGFALAMMAAAMGSGTLDVVMNARLAGLEARVGRALMNLNHGMFSVGYACSALATGFAREAGWSPGEVFLAIGLLVLALLPVMARAVVVDDSPEGAAEQASERLPWAVLLPLGVIVLIGFLAEQGTEGWSALHLERGLGAGAAMGALGPALLGATMAVGRFAGQGLVQRFAEARVIGWAACLSALGAVVAAWAPNLITAYIGFGLLGLGVSVVAPTALAWTGQQVPGRQKTLAISRVAVLGYSGFFVGPPLMGGLSEVFGLAASFTAVAILLLVIPVALVPLVLRASRGFAAKPL